MKDKIWELFKLTGNVKYYLLYKELEEDDVFGEIEDKRDNN